jgi:hypothetical protein
MRLIGLGVNRLFGLFDHTIDLRTDQRITILFGPNGIGKTIILRMVDEFFSGRYDLLQRIPFDSFVLRFEGNATLTISRIPSDAPEIAKRSLAVSYERDGALLHNQALLLVDISGAKAMALAEQIDEVIPLQRSGPTEWRDSTGQDLTLQDVWIRYRSTIERLGVSMSAVTEPQWLKELRETFPPVRLIQTQRLTLTEDASDLPPHRPRRAHQAVGQPTVARYSRDLVEQIRSTLATYASRSQELDRSFPARLIGQTKAMALPADQLSEKLAELETKRSRLIRLGFLDQEPYMSQPAPEALRERNDVLTIYSSDVEQKLATFDDLANRIDLLTNTVNERFQYKSLLIDRQRGFIFKQITGSELTPSDLSSGEQHELVLLYDLLFRLRPHSLVLIDEPEISLHVGWQQSFLSDLQRVVELSDVDVVVATHSPEIIGQHHRLAVMLAAPRVPAI